ncbi:hypothetical protein Dsin_023263 [Dipteronia sinensis]|uniref:RNase H type-1 domain-containing protein n=1 Tax=Dipteronia sinensis TaxID=43782 RepID=A0AAE0A3B0_9ROSI|nr:hypothetical protein Dsin_023263 [Dipteronia sinensis]
MGLGIRSSRGGLLIGHLFFAYYSILFSRVSKYCSLKILRILEVYERGSGQQINLQKSKLTFTPNVLSSHMSETQNLLGVNVCNCQDKYLCLPSMVGRNKRLLFNDIKDRVWKKFRGWNDSMFSFDGNEVLIKAVAQAVPTYAMSIFQIHVGLCKDLSSMFSKFLWGSKGGNRKISWDATIKKGCSHIWRSLLWGRSLLSKGIRWVVGDGNNIHVFKDQWIPRPNTFKPITVNPENDLRVADLLDRNHQGRDTTKLDRAMLPINKDIIMSIPISWRGGKDYIAWHFDNKGVYTVQSGYRLALDLRVGASSSNSSISLGWWNSPWRLNIPPKVRIFVWRACLNVIPSMKNIWKRKMMASPHCIRSSRRVFSSRTLFLSPRLTPTWIPPPPGRFKLNTAAAVSKFSNIRRIGAAIRIDKGLVLAALSNQMQGSFIAAVSELIALREGLQLAIFYNFRVQIAEVVSPSVVSILNDPSAHGWDSKFLVKEILAMLAVVGGSLGQVISKSGNTLAHKLALLAFSSARERLWLANNPLCSSPVV